MARLDEKNGVLLIGWLLALAPVVVDCAAYDNSNTPSVHVDPGEAGGNASAGSDSTSAGSPSAGAPSTTNAGAGGGSSSAGAGAGGSAGAGGGGGMPSIGGSSGSDGSSGVTGAAGIGGTVGSGGSLTTSGNGGAAGNLANSGGAGSGGTVADTLLSQGKPASADSEETTKGNLAALGNDGSLTTRWCAADGAAGHHWQVDLQASYTLSKLEIDWEKAANYQFKVEGSPDGNTWALILDETTSSNATADQTYELTATPTARYVRVTATTLPNATTWASFFELSVYGH